MDTSELYHWDLYGYIVVHDAITVTQVQSTRNALEQYELRPSTLSNRPTEDSLLTLPEPYCEPFRALLAHPALVKRLFALCGKDFRLDASPIALDNESGQKQFSASENALLPGFGYNYQNDTSFTDYVGVIWFLSETSANTEEGCLSIFPGRHKLNYSSQKRDEAEGTSAITFHPGDVLLYAKGKQIVELRPWQESASFCAVHYSYTPRSILVHAHPDMLQPEAWWDNTEFLPLLTAEERVLLFGPGNPIGSSLPILAVDEAGTVCIENQPMNDIHFDDRRS